MESGVESMMTLPSRSQKMPTRGSGVAGLFTVSFALPSGVNIGLGVVFEFRMGKTILG